MNRRENLKSLFLGGISLPLLGACATSEAKTAIEEKKEIPKNSNWHNLPDMDWAGPGYWGNRLQDWQIKDGKLVSLFRGPDRTLHSLSTQIGNSRNRFISRLDLAISGDLSTSKANRIGFLLGAKSWVRDYRASAVKGKGLKVGINGEGFLFIGDHEDTQQQINAIQLQKGVILELIAEPLGINYELRLTVYNQKNEKLAKLEQQNIEAGSIEGNIAILSDIGDTQEDKQDSHVFSVKNWDLEGKKLDFRPDQYFGPVCFAQYTKQKELVKLTAQLMPVALPAKAILEIKENETWKKVATSEIEYPSYTARFKINNWQYRESVPYRVMYDLEFLDNTSNTYYWEGTIAEEPVDKQSLKALVCSCNFDSGFPDQEIVDYASMHNPDVIMFLGDQFYEINGGFGFIKAPLEKAYLDYLRKWYMFGWSYRELFRHRPTINLPDDHDVFQGNLFGDNGKPFPKNINNGLTRDHGGYMMPPEWVNLAMVTQTSHMPDPFNPEPIQQGIHVFYGDWKYAGVSFGIIEDRKFKSGPAAVLPKEAIVRDAYIHNEEYDIKTQIFPEAELIGNRQIEFLNHWIEDWDQQTQFKVLLSAAPFHALQTLPDGDKSNGQQQKLPVPELGEYVKGDVPVSDMDSGGWPQNKRNEMLKIVRKCYAVHLAGDQHLPSVTQYGVENFKDSPVSFAVPALANSWPRRWWPPVPENHHPLPGQPDYTGNHLDAFGNKMHVIAVANPHQTGLRPPRLYNRSPGYGVVTFNKNSREIKMECWPRYINPQAQPDKQFLGWPVTIKQQDNYNPSEENFLPLLEIEGTLQPVIKVIREKDGTVENILRIKGNKYQPVVADAGSYTIEILETESGKSKKYTGISAKSLSNNQVEKIKFDS